MAHPIRDIGRMTTKSKQIDGMGFGGTAPDVNEVAGALAMCHPDTGEKLNRCAYYLARLLYADDRSSRVHVKAGVMCMMLEKEVDLPDVTVAKLVNCALKEIQSPIMRLNRKTGVQELKPTSKSEICRRLDIKGNKLPDKISIAYNQTLEQLYLWNAAAISHVRAAMREDEAA
jgi:hypothetical protein